MMKISILMILVLFISTNAFSQKKTNVPALVKTSFNQKYPNAGKVNWMKDKNGEYEVKFVHEGINKRADFTSNGNWKETESQMTFAALPAVIKEKITKEHGDCAIREVEKVDDPRGSFYEVELVKNKKRTDLMFDAAGNIVAQ